MYRGKEGSALMCLNLSKCLAVTVCKLFVYNGTKTIIYEHTEH